MGVKFRRRQPVGPFVVHFFAAAIGVIIEIDGGIHADQQEQDAERQRILETAGYRFIRIPTDSVMSDATGVRNLIRTAILGRQTDN